MVYTYNQFISTSDNKSIPLPPPYPVVEAVHRRRGFLKSGSANKGQCCTHSNRNVRDRLFDEGYRADVVINTDHGGVIYAHANILLKSRNQVKGHKQSISIRGVPSEAAHLFIRFLYSPCYDEQKMEEYAMQVLVLAHVYAVPHLKRLCEKVLAKSLTSENVTDILQLALLCDVPRLSLIAHRFIVQHFKAVSATDGWKVMKKSHQTLERQLLESFYENSRQKERFRKVNEKKVYLQLYEAMEALVHICREGCRTMGPHDKVPKEDEGPCHYEECKGMELLLRHFAGCKKRVPGGCVHCKRMWQLLELHSHLCADPDVCRFLCVGINSFILPLLRNFKQKRENKNKKVETKWRILVQKIVRSKSISGAPFFSLES
ncbi:hypothetical protein LIER_35634 [Lithospermum erythrorhizon]|uniref:TAZ-type domain-containing protein n=1 Tax=Lithospermum erythrorhizon TaxID=34254 RepID=A0AAV3NWI2_LITER